MAGPIDAVILDFDGTVLDTEWSEYVTIRDEFERLGHPYPLEVFREGVGRGDNRHWTEHLLELTGPLPDLEAIRTRRRQLNDHELAVRLAYFLWSAPPDQKLMELSARNQLHQPEVLREQVDRLIALLSMVTFSKAEKIKVSI